MVQARLIAEARRLRDLKPGEVGFFRKFPFSGGGMVLGIKNEVPIAALFARHPENNRLGAFHLNSDDDAWGGVPVMAFQNAYIECSYKEAKILEHGVSSYDTGVFGSIINGSGKTGFFLSDFHFIDQGKFFGLDGVSHKLEDGAPAVVYNNWSLKCAVESGNIETIFSWPPKN